MDAASGHVPVMLEEVLRTLEPRPGKVFLDGTAGGGGHAAAIWERIQPDGRLILLDRDRESLERLIAKFGKQAGLRYFHANSAILARLWRKRAKR